MRKKIVITGIDGFIGKSLGLKLIEMGYDVIGIGKKRNLLNRKREYFSAYYCFDFFHPENSCKKALEQADGFVHLSAITEHNKIVHDPLSALHLNMFSTYWIANLYCSSRAREFIYASSGKVYGLPQYLPIDELHPLSPLTFLGKIKKIGEDILEYFHTISGKPFTVFRIFNIYGPGQKNNFLIPTIIQNIKMQKEIKLPGNRIKRDYLFIDDLACLFEKAFRRKHSDFRVFNVGSGRSIALTTLAHKIGTMLQQKVMLSKSKYRDRLLEAREECADIVSVSQLDWSPKTSIDTGLHLTLQSYGTS